MKLKRLLSHDLAWRPFLCINMNVFLPVCHSLLPTCTSILLPEVLTNIMLSYLQKANRSVHHIVLTPGETNPVADRALLRAMKQVYGPDGEPKRHSLHGFLINTPMEDDELMTTPVLKWITPGDVLKAMTFEAKSLINKTKEFFNSNQIALWLHETDVPDAKCHARKGPHFHVIVESTTANSRNLKNFRALQTACSKYDCGMFVSKVNSTPDKVYLYQMQDSEKTFLGSNSAFCLENINALLHVDGQVDTFPESTDYDNMADPFAVLNPALVKGPQTGEKRPPPTDMPPRKRSKNIDNLYLLKRCIENNPDVSTLQEMVMLYKATEDYQQLADIFFYPKADKYWSMAQQECAATSQEADIFHRLDDLPDSLRHMLTPEQTLALFNAWCDEQSINAKALAWIIISCLQARVYKKIGVYLQGASNSGKTYWTSTLFHPMNKLVGKMTTGGRFCLQDCGKKRIIVGEEVGIGADNVDRLKELMSGETTTFERKMKAPGQCKANLVLLNSNNLPFANVPQERQALENRMFLFRNLKRSKILPTALKGMEATKPNPKFLRLIEPPTNEELQDLIGGIYPRQGKCSDNLGIVPTFTGDWKQWSDELSQNRKVLESDMAAPEFIIDLDGTLASQPVAAQGTIEPADLDGYSLTDDNNGNVAQWPVNYIATPVDRQIDTRAATTVNKVRMVHLAKHYGAFGDPSKRWRNPKRTYIYEEAEDNTFKPQDIGLDPNFGSYATTVTNMAGLTADGDTNLFQKFPQFIFGVHPDYERKANSILPYNYFANINVTYFSEVEWLLATPAPSYLPIGPGGCDGRSQGDRENYNNRGFLFRALRRRSRRRVMGQVKGNFYIGPNYI